MKVRHLNVTHLLLINEENMKKYLKLASILVCLLAVFSCGQRKQQNKQAVTMKTNIEAEKEFIASLTAEDTTIVLEMGVRCMDFLKSGQVDSALNMLYYIDLQSARAKRLTDERKAKLSARFEKLPVVDYSLDYYSFSTQGNNDLKYRTKFASGPEGKSTSFMLNPIKSREGLWVLAIKDGRYPSDQSVEKLHDLSPAPFYIGIEN